MIETLGQALVNGFLIGGIYALSATGLTLIMGVMRVFNIAHGELIMLAMYATFFFYTMVGIDPFLSLILTMPIFFVVGMGIQVLAVNRILRSHSPEAISVIFMAGLLIFLQNVAAFFWTQDWRALPGYGVGALEFIGLRFGYTRTATFIVALAFTFLIYFFLQKTRQGRAIRACSQSTQAAALMGINVTRSRILTFGLGAGVAGATGSLLLPTSYVFPTVGTWYGLIGIIIVILGGFGSVFGALLGGLLLGITESLTAAYLAAQLKDLAAFIVFIVILLLRPKGLFGKIEA